MIYGSIPALITPFKPSGEVDESAFAEFVEWQITEGSTALVVCGTTGEAATLSSEEQFRAIAACVKQTRRRVPVIAGTGSNDTRVAVRNLHAAKDAGADVALVVPPFYNRPSQDGMYEHFSALARETSLPIIVYNVPARTCSDMELKTLARLVEKFPAIFIGVKDSSGVLARVSEARASLGSAFVQLTGTDETALAFNAMGGSGCISVTANVAPRLSAEFQSACRAGDYVKALQLHDRLFPLHTSLFTDASPGPVKYAVSRVRPGFPATLRLPMIAPNQSSRLAVDAALSRTGLRAAE